MGDGFLPSLLPFSLIFSYTHKVYSSIPCCLFRFGKDLIFILAILKRELKLDEGAINLERQTHFNEIMSLYVSALS